MITIYYYFVSDYISTYVFFINKFMSLIFKYPDRYLHITVKVNTSHRPETESLMNLS